MPKQKYNQDNHPTSSESSSFPRPSTIYDKATLRLHPDGRKASSKRSFRNIDRSVQDPQGNWIADDAFGKRVIKRFYYRSARKGNNGEEDFGDIFQREDSSGSGENENETSGIGMRIEKGKGRAVDNGYDDMSHSGKGVESLSEKEEAEEVVVSGSRKRKKVARNSNEGRMEDTATDGGSPLKKKAKTKKKKKKREKKSKSMAGLEDNDLEFLQGSSTQPLPGAFTSDGQDDGLDADGGDLPPLHTSPLFTQLPSSDLLNAIQHFATRYYAERGQLTQQSVGWREHRAAKNREYRKRRKKRDLGEEGAEEEDVMIEAQGSENEEGLTRAQDAEYSDDPSELPASSSATTPEYQRRRGKSYDEDEGDDDDEYQEQDEDDEFREEDGEEDEDEDSEPDERPRHTKISKRQNLAKRPEHWAEKGWNQDMYRMMDGTALLGIGMLVQTYVGMLLTPNKPDGWDENWLEEEEDDEECEEGITTEINDLEDGKDDSVYEDDIDELDLEEEEQTT